MTYDFNTVEGLDQTLAALSDEKYKVFNDSLIPGGRQSFGVRMPVLRDMARQIAKGDWEAFLRICPDTFHEHRILRSLVTAGAECAPERRLELVREFVPLIDNWAVCDCFCTALKDAGCLQAEYFALAQAYLTSTQAYDLRFAAVLLLEHFINDAYIDRVLDIYADIRHEDYYVRMAVAWGLSICYVRYPEKTLALLTRNRLDDFTHNKTIQKCRESYRVTKEDKAMLQTLKRKTGRTKA